MEMQYLPLANMSDDSKPYVDFDSTYINTDVVECELFGEKNSDIIQLIGEQENDITLTVAYSSARQGKGGYYTNGGLLFQVVK